MKDEFFTVKVPGFQCGGCLATFPGRLSRCPQCGIQLLSVEENAEETTIEKPEVQGAGLPTQIAVIRGVVERIIAGEARFDDEVRQELSDDILDEYGL